MEWKATKEEKVINLLIYLKQNTDEKHPASIPMITAYFDEHFWKNYFGDKNTRKTMIKEITRVLNSDSQGNLLPQDQWRIVYDDFVRDYGDNRTLEEHASHHICNIYYRQEFTDDEIRIILDSIYHDETLDQKEQIALRSKFEKHACSKDHGKWPMTPKERTRQRYQRTSLIYKLYHWNRNANNPWFRRRFIKGPFR